MSQTIPLHNEWSRSCALRVIQHLPVDGTMEIVVQPRKVKRSAQQNALMWGAMLKDVAEQAWVNGRQYPVSVWHEYFKREYLPEGNEPDFERRVRGGYVKWAELPNGERQLVGSTTQLTTYGMSLYIEECAAFAAQELGVRFGADPREACA